MFYLKFVTTGKICIRVIDTNSKRMNLSLNVSGYNYSSK